MCDASAILNVAIILVLSIVHVHASSTLFPLNTLAWAYFRYGMNMHAFCTKFTTSAVTQLSQTSPIPPIPLTFPLCLSICLSNCTTSRRPACTQKLIHWISSVTFRICFSTISKFITTHPPHTHSIHIIVVHIEFPRNFSQYYIPICICISTPNISEIMCIADV